jgi:hypothetical protein
METHQRSYLGYDARGSRYGSSNSASTERAEQQDAVYVSEDVVAKRHLFFGDEDEGYEVQSNGSRCLHMVVI